MISPLLRHAATMVPPDIPVPRQSLQLFRGRLLILFPHALEIIKACRVILFVTRVTKTVANPYNYGQNTSQNPISHLVPDDIR